MRNWLKLLFSLGFITLFIVNGPPTNATPYWDISCDNTNSGNAVGPLVATNGTIYALGDVTAYFGLHCAGGLYKWNACAGWQQVLSIASGSGATEWTHAIAMYETNLYIGGCFTFASNILTGQSLNATNIVKYNIVTGEISTLGDTTLFTNFQVQAITIDTNRTVYVGTSEDSVGLEYNMLLDFTNGNWATFGGPFYYEKLAGGTGISTLAADGTDIYAGGTFDGAYSSVGGEVISTNFIKWDAATHEWVAMGSPSVPAWDDDSATATVRGVGITSSNIFVTGYIYHQSDGDARRINGFAQFSKFGDVLNYDEDLMGVGCNTNEGMGHSLCVQNGLVYVGGRFDEIFPLGGTCADGSLENIACWSNGSWSSLGTGISDGPVEFMAADSNSIYVFAGTTSYGGTSATDGARWVTGTNADPLCINVTSLSACRTNLFISWSESGSATNYVYRATTISGPFTLAAATTDNYLIDTNLSPDTLYYYYIVARYDGGSAYSGGFTLATEDAGSNIFNIQFGSTDATIIAQTGPAAIGNSSGDYWNVNGVSDDADPPGDGDPVFTSTGIFDTCGLPSSINVSTYLPDGDALTGDDNDSVYSPYDGLLKNFVMTDGGSPFDIHIDLPAGTYDIYLYSCPPAFGGTRPATSFNLVSGADNISSFGTESTSTSNYDATDFVAGNQYVCFSGVYLSTAGTLIIEASSVVEPTVNGLQIYQH